MAGTSLSPLRRRSAAAAGPGSAGQRRAERGSERPGGAAAHRERRAGRRDREGTERVAPWGHGAAPSNFPGAGSLLRDFGRTRKNYGRRCACVWMCVMLYSRSWKLSSPPPPAPSPGLPRKKRPPARGCPGAPGVSGGSGARRCCGSGAEGVRGDTNGKRYGRKRPSGWDINQAEYMGSG